jgi:hypothetical protein
MPTYRAYTIGYGNHIEAVCVLGECIDDLSAIATTRILGRGQRIELWDKSRLICTFDDRPKSRS